MDIDKINNSHLILLVMLITVVTSVAIAAVTVALIFDKIDSSQKGEGVQTIFRETINHIIERDSQPVVQKNVEEYKEKLSLEDIKSAYTPILVGLQHFTSGVFITQKGDILVPSVLEKAKLYNIRKKDGELVHFLPKIITRGHTILSPKEGSVFIPDVYIPLIESNNDVIMGQNVLIYASFKNNSQIYSEIISQLTIVNEESSTFKTSVNSDQLVYPSAVFLNRHLLGFIKNSSGWGEVIDSSFYSN